MSIGTALPDGRLTNADPASMMATTTSLAIEAARQALDRSGVPADAIDLVIVATQTPDDLCPSTAAGVQHGLGLTCAAFDLNAACAGFSYGLVTAHSMLATGARAAIVVGVDRMTTVTNDDDRSTAILFGDGAGAVVLVAAEHTDRGVQAWDMGTDGGRRDVVTSPITDGRITGVEMDGEALFAYMVRYAARSAAAAMERAGLGFDDLAAVLANQASQRILDAMAARLGVEEKKVVSVVEHTGNTAAGSIPLALDAAVTGGLVAPGDAILLLGFGGGLSWASAVAIWQ